MGQAIDAGCRPERANECARLNWAHTGGGGRRQRSRACYSAAQALLGSLSWRSSGARLAADKQRYRAAPAMAAPWPTRRIRAHAAPPAARQGRGYLPGRYGGPGGPPYRRSSGGACAALCFITASADPVHFFCSSSVMSGRGLRTTKWPGDSIAADDAPRRRRVAALCLAAHRNGGPGGAGPWGRPAAPQAVMLPAPPLRFGPEGADPPPGATPLT